MRRVLIVDDDRLARTGIMTLLPWAKYDMEVVGDAQNGRSALDFLKKHPVDIAFVDLDMPVMDGLKFIEESRALYPDLLYVVLTFYESFSVVQKVWRLGVVDYISKMELESVDVDEVLRRISMKMPGTAEPPRGVPSDSGEHLDEDAWHVFCRKWDDLHWLYDDLHYRALCERARALMPSSHQMEQLLFRLLPLIAEHTGFDEPPLSAIRRERILNWLSEYRLEVLTRLAGSEDLTKFPVSVAKVVRHAKAHLGESLHTGEMAQSVNLSRSYFSQIFKQYAGVPFNELLQKIRVQEAMKLLRESDLLIADVASLTGYEDVKSFVSVFVRHTGMTPREYRRREDF